MKNVMGVINVTESPDMFQGLITNRTLATLPFGGRYCLIDFILSNMVNSNIYNVGIFAKNYSRSLMDHIGTASEWDLNKRQDRLFILTPHQTTTDDIGDAGLLYQHLDYFERSTQDVVVLADSSTVSNINFTDAVQFHLDKKADITVMYQSRDVLKVKPNCTLIDLDANQRVTGMEINPFYRRSKNMSLKIYIISKTLLMELVDQLVSRGEKHIVMDGIVKNISSLKVYGFDYQGYLACVCSLQSYYHHNMNLLQPEVWGELFSKPGLIYTKFINAPPANYRNTAKVKNSIVANGCVIEGHIENCVIFPDVKVEAGAYVKDSLIMHRSVLKTGCHLQNVILDKEVTVTENKHLVGDWNYPLVVEKKVSL